MPVVRDGNPEPLKALLSAATSLVLPAANESETFNDEWVPKPVEGESDPVAVLVSGGTLLKFHDVIVAP